MAGFNTVLRYSEMRHFVINCADGALCKRIHLFGMNSHCMGTRY